MVPHWSKSSGKLSQSLKASRHAACTMHSALTGDMAQTPRQHQDLTEYAQKQSFSPLLYFIALIFTMKG